MLGLRRFASLVSVLATPVFATCSSPSEVPSVDTTGGKPQPIFVTRIEIQTPSVIQVAENVLPGLTAYAANGSVLAGAVPANEVTWSTDDRSVAIVSDRGVVTGLRRGTVHVIARYRTIDATVSLKVKARVRISADYTQTYGWYVATNDSMHLTPYYVDVNGRSIPDVPTVQWSSSEPQLVSVDEKGEVVGRAFADPNHLIKITASASDDTTFQVVHVADAYAGQPASIRFANGNPGAPLTFVPSQGPPITLKFGEYADIPILSGMFTVFINGYPVESPWRSPGATPGGFRTLIAAGDSPAVYVVPGYGDYAAATVLSRTVTVAADQSAIELIQASGMSIVYLRDPLEPAIGLPELCYFDPLDGAVFVRKPGKVDVIGFTKYGSPGAARFESNVLAGHETTIVLIGTTPSDFQIVEFPHP